MNEIIEEVEHVFLSYVDENNPVNVLLESRLGDGFKPEEINFK